MGSISRTTSLIFMGFLFLLAIQQLSNCRKGYECFFAEATSKRFQTRKVQVGELSEGSKASLVVGWELRKVPSGPDPLHHNGASPKKPRKQP